MLAVLLAFLLPSPAWAVNAFITSGGSTNVNSPTPIAIGQTLTITGHCDKGFLESRETSYLWLYKPGSPKNYKLGTYSTAAELDHVRASFAVGTLPFTEEVGAVFNVQLACRGGSNGFADRYYRVIAAPKPPTVEPFGIWMDGWVNEKTVDITAYVTDAGSGIGKVWIKWTGEDAVNIEMTDKGKYYLHTINASDMPDGVKDVQIWAETPSHANNGWQPAGSFTLDRTPPVLSNNSIDDRLHQAVVRIHATDNLTGVNSVKVKWEGREANMELDRTGDYHYTIDKDGLRSGDIPVQIQARDGTGNETGWVAAGSMTGNHSVPTIAWDKRNAKFASDTMRVRAQVTAASGFRIADVWIWWHGAPQSGYRMTRSGDGSFTYNIPTAGLEDGSQQKVMFWAKDDGGAETSWLTPSGASFIVDRSAPVINWTEPKDLAVLTDDRIRIAGNLVEANPDIVTIEWQAEDDTAWQSHIEKPKAGSNDFEYQLSGLKRGVNYRLRIQATDKAGNVSIMTPARTIIGQLPAKVLFNSAQLAVLDDSLADKDDSGGLSAGDDLIYTVALEAADMDAIGVSLRYALPPGLATTPDLPPYFAPDSAIADGAKLNAHWNGADNAQLLADGVDLPANKKLIVQIPVTITGVDAVSTVFAGARNAKDEWRLEHSLTPQDKYPAHRALDLALASLQQDWKYRPGNAFDYRITVHVREWDLSDVELRYALPAGLERNGDVRIESDGMDAVQLNSAWGKDGAQLLLSSIRGVKLKAGHSLNVVVPVRVGVDTKPGSALQSNIETRASNLSGPVTAMHRIVLEDSTEPEEQLLLEKTVDKKNARPGEVLRYTIRFKNVGIDTLYDPVIKDAIQTDYLTLKEARCDSSISINLHCSVVKELPPGQLKWRLDGKLEAGDFGSVSYEATVNRR